MAEKRLIDANALIEKKRQYCCGHGEYDYMVELWHIENAPTVDAVEMVRIKEVKQEILQKMDEFIAEYRHISQSYVDHFGGKADAMEVARRLVNAALYDLCSNSGAKTDGERKDKG